MNFQEWYNKVDNYREPCDTISPSMAWDACKKEVLKILNKNKFHVHDTQLKHDVEEAIDIDAIREIEDL